MGAGARLLALRCDGAILLETRVALRRWETFRQLPGTGYEDFLSLGEMLRIVMLRQARDRFAAIAASDDVGDLADIAFIAQQIRPLIDSLNELVAGWREESLPDDLRALIPGAQN